MIPIIAAICISAIYFAGAIASTNPEASLVIVALCTGFLGILYFGATMPDDDDYDEIS